MFYHTDRVIHFNSAKNNQCKRWKIIAFSIFLSDGLRKENLEILGKLRLRIII